RADGQGLAGSIGRTGIGAPRWSRSCARCGSTTSSGSPRSSKQSGVRDVEASEAGEVEVSVRVPGTPEAVFPYFTEPDKYTRWKGLEADLDPRPGGIYRVKMFSGVWVEG